ncbi:hypothetical protein B1222_00575 [Paenibacillus larvae subsp. pulvifaciens]|uniref:Uncharacterized protein n=2 Tax=Paenibacillus larvae TaxID=1464 RepID=A0A1U9YSN0_9BACL|nr:hypothetical protein [Paenibacillus larvae]AQR76987.1 hypothetical protein BXP28_06035 [Paenibacillus larvae subsp. larvae]AQT83294.1 hypothetical protein B1222_00575 [Paenibacillus larvae subsp. pulvifaciens]AQZ48420.1 hypothetical protein B5S25_19340 [Paenibacillus larvae subsp. pulvifaciens]ARF70302.1 hypothetical protein B7C51_24340 [Paenibacillus larvae subsp. pulvifaciens]MBH0344806.1 hypothetical protein [Paenibacillus larvae]
MGIAFSILLILLNSMLIIGFTHLFVRTVNLLITIGFSIGLGYLIRELLDRQQSYKEISEDHDSA